MNLQFLPASVYNAASGWSINYTLTYGEGGLFRAPTTFTNTFAGEVWPGFQPDDPFVPPLISSNGYFLLSCVIPVSGASFFDVVGRQPLEGESVTRLDASTQTYFTATFQNGAWNPEPPLLAIGEAAFFNLGPVVIPEPQSLMLIVLGLVAAWMARSATTPNPMNQS